MESELTKYDVKELFNKNRDYIIKIYSGDLHSDRRQEFIKNGFYRDNLRKKMVTPFSDDHHSVILDEISNIWMSNPKDEMENSNFIWMVILPEMFVKVK